VLNSPSAEVLNSPSAEVALCAAARPKTQIHVKILSVLMANRKLDPSKTQTKEENKTMTPDQGEIEQTFALLGNSEQMVLKLRSGLVDGHRHSLREVSTFLGTTRAAARSLEWQGWQKLQAHAQNSEITSSNVQYILERCRIRKSRSQN
jgi:hypothetical protein